LGLIYRVLAYILPHESPSSSIVEKMLAIARLANAEIAMMGGIGLPPVEGHHD